MVKKVVLCTLSALLVTAMLVGCSSRASWIQPPGTIPPPDDGNRCGWPEQACDMTALQMLDGIQEMATASPDGTIEDADRQGISSRVPACKDPQLESMDPPGVHVCDVTDPDACARLWIIYLNATHAYELAMQGVDVPKEMWAEAEEARAKARRLWHTVATDLDIFPSNPPPSNQTN